MNRFLKIALIVFGVLAALVATAAIVLPLIVNPNQYRDEIAAAVEDRSGRELAIPGDIGLSVFPWLGVELGELRLANAAGFGDEPFAEIGGAGVRVKLLPLLRKRIEIGTVTLTDMRLRLARKANGRSNWDDLSEAFASAQEAPEKPPEENPDGFTMPDLQIEAIKIENAAVSFDDRASGERYELSELNLSTGRLRPHEPFPLRLSFAFAARKLGLATHSTLVAQIEPELASRFVRLPEFKLEVVARGEALPAGEQQFALTGGGEFDAGAGRLKLRDLMLQAAGVNVAAGIEGERLLETPEFNGRITVQQFSPRALMQRLGMEAPATRDAGVLAGARFDTQFEATPEGARLKQVLIELDDSSFRGEIGVTGFDKPAIDFRLALDQLDVDRYLPPKGAGDGEKATPAAEIDLEPLKTLKLDGRLTAGRLKVANLNVENAELAITARDGVLRIEPLGANLYGGVLRLQSTVNAAGKRPTYAIQGDLNGLRVTPLLKDLAGSEKIEALGNLALDLTTAGTTTGEMIRSLNGSVSFELRDGTFTGFNLPTLLEAARRQFLEQGKTDVKPAGRTEFSRFAASFKVADGLLKGRDLSLRSDEVEAAGAGSYDLAANNLDYTVNAKVSEGAGGDLAKLAGLTVPIKLRGDLFSPSFNIDMAGALKGAAKQKLQEEKQELRQKADEKVEEKKREIDDKVQKEVQEGLKKLFDKR
jgi:AsmA protein